MAAALDGFKFDYFEGLLSAPDGSDACRTGGKTEKRIMQNVHLLLEAAGLRQGFSSKTGRDYSRGVNWHQGAETQAVVFVHHGSTQGATPRLTVKGGHGFCARFAPMLQAADPNFRAIRVDVCLDLLDAGPEAFDKLLDMSTKFAAGTRIAPPDIWGGVEKGRTFYLTGRGGVKLRVYQKGLEQRGKGSLDAPAGWLRIEFQFDQIEGQKKLSVARATPGELVRHKDFSRKWFERAAALLDLAGAHERAARFVAEFKPKVKTLGDAMNHGVRQYGRTFIVAAEWSIINDDFGGDRLAAVRAGALEPDAVAARAGELFAARLDVRRVQAVTRLGVDEDDEARAEAAAERLQAEHEADLEREVRARARLREHVEPVTRAAVNRVELQASEAEARMNLEAVRAARAGDDTPPPRRSGRFVSTRPAVIKWDLSDQARGERLLAALESAGVHRSNLHAALALRPAGWIRDGLSVGEAVMDPAMNDHLHRLVPFLAARMRGEAVPA